MSGDYSRKIFKPSHNYSGVLMQQGRVQLDADWNDQIEITHRRQRAETVDIIGRAVVPMETPDGFKIELNNGELIIYPGRMYVDGLLAENHGANPNHFNVVLDEESGTQPLRYQDQPFFPNAESIEPLPGTRSGPLIAYIDVWQREVTYVKQPDLVEPAIGVDTTARWQTVWQVKVLPMGLRDSTAVECGDQLDAWDNLIAPSAGRLSTAIVEPQEVDDVCLVPTEGGYRALENRLYRVEVHDGGDFGTATFKWARHNASIETAVNKIDGTELVVAQSEWDESRRFNQNDWVEITDDVRELAGLPGEMRRVSDIDYASNTITLDAALPAADFPTSATNATNEKRHTRIKRWDQQNEVDENTGLLTVTNAPFYVEDGIQINFSLDTDAALSGEFKTGDYWLFYARSAIADIEILEEAPPRGIHHHYARLAILNFPNEQDDCRIHWPPQSANACCCTITVGDGDTSHGQYDRIQEAIDQLPLTGGKICLLPGIYQESIVIQGKTDIIISGCGKRTRLISMEDSELQSEPVIRIENSKNIRIESLAIESNQAGEGILIREIVGDIDRPGPSFKITNVELDDLTISAGVGSAIRCEVGEHISIQNNKISMRDVLTQWPGIFVIGTEVLIENNTVMAESLKSKFPNAGRGGIQIGGGSEQVQVLNNYIQQGLGDGITLGSLSLVNDNEIIFRRMVASAMIADDPCDPCSPPPVKIPPQFFASAESDDVPDRLTFISAGDLYDIVIENNRIQDMGRNGIGVVGFFDLEQSDEFISVENLHIGHNHIESCLNRVLPAIEENLEDDIGYGGIALADVMNLVIHHNDILNNGRNHIDPICGIYVLHGEGVEICDNRIINNGEKSKANTERVREKRGARSGIHLVYAITPTVPLFPDNQKLSFPRQNGVPAAKIHNNVVSHPVGRALTINALGPVVVTDNQLTSRGILAGQASAIASTVAILNLGLSNEFYQQLTSFSQMVSGQVNLTTVSARTNAATADGVRFSRRSWVDFNVGRYLANGNVMFSDNQVVLDEIDAKTNTALSAVAIMSMDDIAFHNNQCDYSLWRDFLLFPNFILAPSVRVADNRFKESFNGALISGITFGLMNTTTGNQATHCLLVVGNLGLKIDAHNIALIDTIIPPIGDNVSFCELIKAQIRETLNLGDRL